jgi:perosamine synthetase
MSGIDINNFLCPINECLYYALEKLNNNKKERIFIINQNMEYMMTLSESDIRQAILSKYPLDANISRIISELGLDKQNSSATSASIGTEKGKLQALASESNPLIPILDRNKRIIDVYEFEKIFYAPVASPNLNGNELPYLIKCIESNWISSQGNFVTSFEESIATFIGSKYAVSVSNGTCALHLALLALGIGKDDEVIVPDMTFAATANAVIHAGARPVLVDIDSETWNISTEAVLSAITPKTKAIIPVHLYGLPANMPDLLKIAQSHNLKIIEDCAESIGASINGVFCGNIGDISCFSFFGNKIITTGEGGMCLTNDLKTAEKIKMLRDHGMDPNKRYWHTAIGYNYRLTNLQAAIGVAQMERIHETLEKRENIRKCYHDTFKDLDCLKPSRVPSNCKAVTWLVSYLLEENIDRSLLIKLSKEKGIDIRPFFYPLSDMPPYQGMQYKDTPVCHEISSRGINLPTSLVYSTDDYKRIIDELLKLFKQCIK